MLSSILHSEAILAAIVYATMFGTALFAYRTVSRWNDL
jgi:hypothetical protein